MNLRHSSSTTARSSPSRRCRFSGASSTVRSSRFPPAAWRQPERFFESTGATAQGLFSGFESRRAQPDRPQRHQRRLRKLRR